MIEHLKALAEGLEIPNIEWYITKDPQALRLVGEAIARQAKQAEEIQRLRDDMQQIYRCGHYGAAKHIASKHLIQQEAGQ